MNGLKKPSYIYTLEYYTAERKKALLPFTIAWMESESIILSEISHTVKDKYHMISPFNRNLINKTNKQAKYNQRHWHWEQTDSDQREQGREFQGNRVKGFRNNYKGHMDNNRGAGATGGRWGGLGVGLEWGEKAENCKLKKHFFKILAKWHIALTFYLGSVQASM